MNWEPKKWIDLFGSCMVLMLSFLIVTKGWFTEWRKKRNLFNCVNQPWALSKAVVVVHPLHLSLASVFVADSPLIFILIENDCCERKRAQSYGSRRWRARSACSHCCYWRQQFHIHRFHGSTHSTVCEYFNIAGSLPESFALKSAYVASVLFSLDFLHCLDLGPRVN